MMIDEAEVSEVLRLTSWNDGAVELNRQGRAIAALEAGRVLVLPELAFSVQFDEARLMTAAAAGGDRKNISFDPSTKRCHGTSFTGADADALARMMDRFGEQAIQLLGSLFPNYRPGLQRARTS